jgi:hypothetical protein
MAIGAKRDGIDGGLTPDDEAIKDVMYGPLGLESVLTALSSRAAGGDAVNALTLLRFRC